MSVYQRPDSPWWWCEFTIDGQRFRRSTGETTRGKAEKIERRFRREAREELENVARSGVTLGRVLGYFWEHYGQYDADSATTFGRLERLEDLLGAETLVESLDDATMISYVLRRRAIPTPRGTLPAPATVNRDVELLRRVLHRTRKGLRYAMPDIDWGELRQEEPEERLVEFTEAERRALFAALREDAAALFEHYFMTGVRASMAIGLLKTDIDWGAETVRFIGKGDRETVLPLTPQLRALYARQLEGNATDHVFTYIAQRTRAAAQKGRQTVKGRRYPYTLSQVRALWRRAIEKAVDECPTLANRRVHDIRHDFGTKFYRANKDIRATQRALGHRDSRSTERYAHTMPDDLRDAMARHHASHVRPHVVQDEGDKIMKIKRKTK